MRTTTTVILTALLGIIIAPPSALAVQVLPPDLGITDSFATMEDAEIACREALGVPDEKIGSLLFYIRRCVNTLWKREQNKMTGERKMERRLRMHSRLNERAQTAIESASQNKDIRTDLMRRVNQQVTTRSQRMGQFAEQRSSRRVLIRSTERDMKEHKADLMH